MSSTFKTLNFAVFSAFLAVTGCKSDSNGGGAADAAVDSPISIDDAAQAGACTVPTSGYGTEVGRKFRPFTLNDCDGNSYAFYGDQYCANKFTVVSIAAGWCGPCMQESGLMEDLVTSVYGPQGVRVIQTLIQDGGYGPPDADFCHSWRNQFGLESNVELLDPAQVTNIYFPAGSLPATLIVDNQGVIRFREYGVSTNLQSLRTKLDELLAEEE